MSAKRESAKKQRERGVTRRFIKVFLFILLFVLGYQKELQGEPLPVTELVSARAQKFTLDNGMIAIIKEVPNQALVSVGAFLNAGSSTEDRFLGSGISHLTEHMLFKGTQSRGVGEIEREVKSYGGKINGFTSFDYTGYSITLASQYFDKAIDIIGDFLLNPSVDPQELEKEKNVILREINLNRDNPSKLLYNFIFSNAYSRHPYRYPIIGKEELLSRLTRNDVLEYHRLMYIPRNLTIVVVGNVDTQKTLSRIKETFNNFPSYFSSSLALFTLQEPRQVAAKKIVRQANLKSVYFGLAFHGVELANRDLYALDLLATILGKGESSRLNRALNQEKKIFDTIGALNFTPRYPGLFVISGTTEEDNLNKLTEAVFTEIEMVKKGLVKKTELDKAKNQLKTDYFFSQETLGGQVSDLGLNELLVGDFSFSKSYTEEISLVTLKDIQRVAKQYLTKTNSISCALIPSSARTDGKAGERKETHSQIIKKILNNGLVILLKEDHRLPLVSIVAAFRGGVRAEEDNNNGISYLTAQSLSLTTRSRDGKKVSESIEAMGGEISSFSGNNSLGVSLNLPSSNTKDGLRLLGDMLINPRFSQNMIEREKEKMFARLKREEDDLFGSGFRLLKTNLFRDHPYRLHYLGTRQSLDKITGEDVINFSNKFIVSGNMVLSVFGDFQQQKILKEINNIFGRMKQGKPGDIKVGREPVLEKIIEFSKNINKEQDLIILGFPGVSVYDEDRYPLELISSITRSRLYKRIREEKGLAYTLGAFLVSGIDPGYYSFYVATNYDNSKEVKRDILNEISRLKEEIIDDDELRVAKTGLIGRTMISLQGNSSLAFKVSLDELYGLGFNDHSQHSKRINKITAEDVKRVANKYFDLNAYVIIMLTRRLGDKE